MAHKSSVQLTSTGDMNGEVEQVFLSSENAFFARPNSTRRSHQDPTGSMVPDGTFFDY